MRAATAGFSVSRESLWLRISSPR